MTREEQDRRIAELEEWTTGELALHITLLETALREIVSSWDAATRGHPDELYQSRGNGAYAYAEHARKALSK